MTIETSGMREHIRQTLKTINGFGGSVDIMHHRQLSQMIGDQYEALIDLSVAELRALASNNANAIVAGTTEAGRETFVSAQTAYGKS